MHDPAIPRRMELQHARLIPSIISEITISILNYCRANRAFRFNSRPFLDRYLLYSEANTRNYDRDRYLISTVYMYAQCIYVCISTCTCPPFITTVVDINIDTQDKMYINVEKC